MLSISKLHTICCELYTKIQKMKAIHNNIKHLYILLYAVNYTQRYKKWKQFTTSLWHAQKWLRLWTIHKDTKNESNSQLCARRLNPSLCCELYTKIQKMKAIHNWYCFCIFWRVAVNYTQRYKKWKQFTTSNFRGVCWKCCELYTKIQKMKAIHNIIRITMQKLLAVNYTQRYKKWKQFTTHH